MELLSIVALVLLTLVGFSSGTVLARRGLVPVPTIGDLLIVLGLWMLALLARGELGRWPALLVGLGAGLLVGAVTAPLRRAESARRFAPLFAEPPAGPPSGLGRRALEGWKRFALAMGNYQGRMMMGFFYFLVVTPFAAISAVVHRRAAPGRQPGSLWVEGAGAATAGLEQARRQF